MTTNPSETRRRDLETNSVASEQPVKTVIGLFSTIIILSLFSTLTGIQWIHSNRETPEPTSVLVAQCWQQHWPLA